MPWNTPLDSRTSKKRQDYRQAVFVHSLLCVIAMLIGAPFFWLITTSLKSMSEIFTYPPVWIPKQLMWENYVKAWHAAPFGIFYINSVIVSVAGVGTSLVVCVLAAYALACIPTRWNNIVFVAFLSTMMIPSEASILPNYSTISSFNWIDTYLGLVVPGIASGFGIFLIRQSFLQTPIDLLDAAKLDGAGHLFTLKRVVVPLSKPILITFGLFSFLWKWNAYLWPLIVTNSESMRTLPIGLAMLREQEGITEWNMLMAGIVFVLIPVFIAFIFAQRYFIEGVAHTGLKG